VISVECLRCILLSGWRSVRGGDQNSDLENGICDLLLLCQSYRFKQSLVGPAALGNITQFLQFYTARWQAILPWKGGRKMSACKKTTTWLPSWLQKNKNLPHLETEFNCAGGLKTFCNSSLNITTKSPLKY